MRQVDTKVELIDPKSPEDVYQTLELCGRVAYKSEAKITTESAIPFIKKLIGMGHESVLEHQSITVRITTDRATTHALVRHRIASYTQESTIYCDYGKEGEIQCRTPFFITEPGVKRIWVDAMLSCEKAYQELRELGIAPGIARDVLPNALKTELIATHNIRSWREMLVTRAVAGDSFGMHLVIAKLYAKFLGMYPVLFKDLMDRMNMGVLVDAMNMEEEYAKNNT